MVCNRQGPPDIWLRENRNTKSFTGHRGRYGRQKVTVGRCLRGLAACCAGAARQRSGELARRAVSPVCLGDTHRAQRSGQGKRAWGIDLPKSESGLPIRRTEYVQVTGRQRKNFPAASEASPESFSIRRLRLALTPARWIPTRRRLQVPVVQLLTLLLMAILTKALLTLVRSNFVTFTFFSARHTAAELRML